MPRSISLNRLASSKKKWSLKEVDALYDIYKNNFGTKGENITPPSPYKKAKKHGSLRRTSTIPTPSYSKTFDDYQEHREKAAARVNAEFMRSI